MNTRSETQPDVARGLAAIAAAAADPFLAQQVRHLQERAAKALREMMHETYLVLAAHAGAPPALSGGAVNVSALAGAARHRQSQGLQQRELAEALVFGALINAGNPAWNPNDPSTSRAVDDNLLLALMQAELPEQQAAAPAGWDDE